MTKTPAFRREWMKDMMGDSPLTTASAMNDACEETPPRPLTRKLSVCLERAAEIILLCLYFSPAKWTRQDTLHQKAVKIVERQAKSLALIRQCNDPSCTLAAPAKLRSEHNGRLRDRPEESRWTLLAE